MKKSLLQVITIMVLTIVICIVCDFPVQAGFVRRNYSEIKFSEYSMIVELHIGPDEAFDLGPNDVRTFNNMLNLANITVDEGNPYLSSYHGCLYNKEQTKLICFPQGLFSASIPDTCVEIAPGALYGVHRYIRNYVKGVITRNNDGIWPGYSKYVNYPVTPKKITSDME